MQPCACIGTTQGIISLCACQYLEFLINTGCLMCFGTGNMSLACNSTQLLLAFFLDFALPSVVAAVALEVVTLVVPCVLR